MKLQDGICHLGSQQEKDRNHGGYSGTVWEPHRLSSITFSGLLLCCYFTSSGLCQLKIGLCSSSQLWYRLLWRLVLFPLEIEQHVHWYHAVSVSSISSALTFFFFLIHKFYIGTERKYSGLLHNLYLYCTLTAGLLNLYWLLLSSAPAFVVDRMMWHSLNGVNEN